MKEARNELSEAMTGSSLTQIPVDARAGMSCWLMCWRSIEIMLVRFSVEAGGMAGLRGGGECGEGVRAGGDEVQLREGQEAELCMVKDNDREGPKEHCIERCG